MLRGLQLCDGLVRGDAQGWWASADFITIVTQKRTRIKHNIEGIEGPRGWGVLMKIEGLMTLLTALGKRVDEHKRSMVSNVLERILAGETGFIEIITEEAAGRYFRCWRRGDSMFTLASIRGVCVQSLEHWSVIDAILSIWPEEMQDRTLARHYYDRLPAQLITATVYADFVGSIVTLNEPTMTLPCLLRFIDMFDEHQKRKNTVRSAFLKKRLLETTRIVVAGHVAVRGEISEKLELPDGKFIRGTSAKLWSVYDFINVVCGRALDDAFGLEFFNDVWNTAIFGEELHMDAHYGAITTIAGLRYILLYINESEYGAKVALMLE